MSDTQYSHTVSRRLDSGWTRPTTDQKFVLWFTSFFGVVLWLTQGGLWALVPASIGFLLYAPIYERRRGFKKSGINTIYSRWENAQRRRRGGDVYSLKLGDTVLTYDSESQMVRSPARSRKTHPAELFTIRPSGVSGNGAQFAFVRNKIDRNNDYVIAGLMLDGAPNFVNSGRAQRFIWDKVFVAALKRAVNTTMLPIQYCQYVMGRPADPTEPADYADSRWHSDFFDAPEGSVEAKLAEDFRVEAEAIYGKDKGRNYYCGVLFRMPFPREWRRKDLNELTLEQVITTELMRVVQTALVNMRHAFTDVRAHSLFELNEVYYMLFNSVELDGFYAQQYKDIQSEKRGELKNIDDAITLRRGPFPASVQVYNDCVLTNKTWSSTVVPIEYESATHSADHLDTLFSQPYSFTFSRFVQTVPHRKSMRRARGKRRLLSFSSGLKGHSGGRDLHLEDQELEQDAELEHVGLYHSKSRGISARDQFTVHAASYDECQQFAKLAIGDFSNHGIVSLQVLGEVAQFDPILAHLGIIGSK